jgi:hypothetical protein
MMLALVLEHALVPVLQLALVLALVHAVLPVPLGGACALGGPSVCTREGTAAAPLCWCVCRDTCRYSCRCLLCRYLCQH